MARRNGLQLRAVTTKQEERSDVEEEAAGERLQSVKKNGSGMHRYLYRDEN